MSRDSVYSAVSFELDGDRVRSIFIVRNPDKLLHLSSGSEKECSSAPAVVRFGIGENRRPEIPEGFAGRVEDPE
jgi:hypothetical protein